MSDPDSHGIWLVNEKGAKMHIIGFNNQGSADGVAIECELAVPLGVAVSGSTVFWVQGDGRLRMFSLPNSSATS